MSNRKQDLNSSTLIAENVTAKDITAGDLIAMSKKDLLRGKGRLVGSITTPRPGQASRERVQLRDGEGVVIRSCEPTTKLWRAERNEDGSFRDSAYEAHIAEEEAAGIGPEDISETDSPAGSPKPEPKAAPKPKAKPKAEPKAEEEAGTITKADVLEYLKDQASDAQDAPNQGLPFIDGNGIVRIRGEHFREWLIARGKPHTKGDAAKPLRELGLKVRPFAIPGEGRGAGFYTGEAPRGTAGIKVREGGRRAAAPRPFGKLTAEQAEVIGAALTAYEFAEDQADLAKVRDELLEQLPA